VIKGHLDEAEVSLQTLRRIASFRVEYKAKAKAKALGATILT